MDSRIVFRVICNRACLHHSSRQLLQRRSRSKACCRSVSVAASAAGSVPSAPRTSAATSPTSCASIHTEYCLVVRFIASCGIRRDSLARATARCAARTGGRPSFLAVSASRAGSTTSVFFRARTARCTGPVAATGTMCWDTRASTSLTSFRSCIWPVGSTRSMQVCRSNSVRSLDARWVAMESPRDGWLGRTGGEKREKRSAWHLDSVAAIWVTKADVRVTAPDAAAEGPSDPCMSHT